MITNTDDHILADELVDSYLENQELVKRFLDQILVNINGSADLEPLVHSIRSRMKEANHLKKKILRKCAEARKEKKKFDVTKDNLLSKINDLAGIRILHLYTDQFEFINKHLLEIFEEHFITIIEGPTARTWDIEYKSKFQSLGISTEDNERMYTSVHYIVESNSKRKVTCEIQVRTLMEEVWGEVDHKINYPEPTESLPCREQIRALARVTSSATRLVDAIFASAKDFDLTSKKRKKNTRALKS